MQMASLGMDPDAGDAGDAGDRVPVTNITHFMCFFSLKWWGGFTQQTTIWFVFLLKDMISTWGGCFGGYHRLRKHLYIQDYF